MNKPKAFVFSVQAKFFKSTGKKKENKRDLVCPWKE